MLASVMGVALVAADGVRNRRRLDRLLKRNLMIFGAINAAIGIIQFATGFDLAARIVIPGLHPNSDFTAFKVARGAGAFIRVTGTSTHPIEFGVMLAILLPLALHYAMHAQEGYRFRRWLVVGLLACSVPLSVSRLGTLALFVVVIVVFNAWAPRIKLQGLIVAMAGLVAFSGVVPGLLGTIKSSFTNLSSDPSVEGRTDDYNIVFTYIGNRPWFGRGPGTFLPSRYIVLDNEALYTLVTTGYVGLVAVIALFVTMALIARKVSRTGKDDATRHLAICLMAGVMAFFFVSFTFDSLSFPICTGLVFFLFGAIGALWRLDRAGDISGRVRRSTSVLKGWRSVEKPEPHGLWRVFTDPVPGDEVAPGDDVASANGMSRCRPGPATGNGRSRDRTDRRADDHVPSARLPAQVAARPARALLTSRCGCGCGTTATTPTRWPVARSYARAPPVSTASTTAR